MVDSTPDPKALLEGTTPGPWTAQLDGYFCGDVRSANAVVAEVFDPDADARLIAAAPALAARLVEAEAQLDEAVRLLRICRPVLAEGELDAVVAFLSPPADGEQPHE